MISCICDICGKRLPNVELAKAVDIKVPVIYHFPEGARTARPIYYEHVCLDCLGKLHHKITNIIKDLSLGGLT